MQQQNLIKIFFIIALIVILRIYFQTSTSKDTIDNRTLALEFPSQQYSFAALPSGLTHYQRSGQQNAPVNVLIHGVSGPMSVWDKTVPYLNQEGLQTLRFDLFGRGFSARLTGDYTLTRFVTQLEELLSELKIDGPLNLIGSSFGCIIASQYAIDHPDRVQKIVFIGPAGFAVESPTLAKAGEVPILGDVIFKLMGKSLISDQNRAYFLADESWLAYRDYFLAQLNIAGSDMALLSTMRHSPVTDFSTGYQTLAKTRIPVLAIWGKEDRTFPYANHQRLQEYIPELKLTTINKAAHLPMYEQADQVGPFIASYLENKKS